jgi:hypothetical protein
MRKGRGNNNKRISERRVEMERNRGRDVNMKRKR